ncbi:nitric oxide response protein [Sulfolobus sp. E11-6]|uniref:nitric oxide response protein n=1 Tax=Sulfolobus sp. E11-6 TaxID=2663020 RepID=UPI0012951DEA|nr:nitric oxide response protein [Sulfolobus sp. E11-6]QGA69153.1 nitric oxide response protein [Sulfolobus sp. E11-6]
MRLPLLLMIVGILLLLLGGIPAVFEFMDMQGFFLDPTASLFPAHWFIMIYGFFGALIGNEILVALSIEWSGKTADNKLIVIYLLSIIFASISFLFISQQLGFIFTLLGMAILLYYSREYLGTSKLGLQPTTYNWLLFYSIMLSTAIVALQLGLGYTIPYVNLIFPASMILAVMDRDVALVTGIKIARHWENVLAFILLIIGMGVYPNGSVLMFIAWILSFHASGLYRFKGRKYPILHLTTAWIYLLLASIFVFNYDIYIHALAVGFLFNTVFGVDVVLMDLFVNAFERRIRIKPSYVPFVLVNLGLIMRFLYDFGLSIPILLLSAPLQGIGILSFFALTLKQVVMTK